MPTLSLQHRIELVSGPATEPLTLSEVKTQLRVEHNDEDALIARLIQAAIDYVDVTGTLGKAMITQTWGEWVAPNPGTVTLSLGPIQSVSAIKYYDADNALQNDTLSNYHVLGRPGKTIVKPKSGQNWPTVFVRDDAIKIEYVVGYGDTARTVPQTIRHGLMMLIGHWYENRENELIGTISKTLPHGFEALMDFERGSWYG
jgi:uncharacterized phiE125 gp8 family phage protein